MKKNIDAFKIWCRKQKVSIYFGKNHTESPECCKTCAESCSFSEKIIQDYSLWLSKCPIGNEYAYDKGVVIKVQWKVLSNYTWQTFRLVYSMPAAVVHHKRNEWNQVRRNKKNTWRDYGRFVRRLSKECEQKVPHYIPELAWWKNPKMDLNCNFVVECKSKLDQKNYSS